jgi:hypothetical protein
MDLPRNANASCRCDQLWFSVIAERVAGHRTLRASPCDRCGHIHNSRLRAGESSSYQLPAIDHSHHDCRAVHNPKMVWPSLFSHPHADSVKTGSPRSLDMYEGR